jgi:hypothetical protein
MHTYGDMHLKNMCEKEGKVCVCVYTHIMCTHLLGPATILDRGALNQNVQLYQTGLDT